METIIYSAKWCNGCKRLKSYLDSKNIEYTVKDIEDDGNKEELNALGYSSIPVLVKNDIILVGFDKNKLDEIFS